MTRSSCVVRGGPAVAVALLVSCVCFVTTRAFVPPSVLHARQVSQRTQRYDVAGSSAESVSPRRATVARDSEVTTPLSVSSSSLSLSEDESLTVIRRTAALVLSMAVQRVLPGSCSEGMTWMNDGFFCDFSNCEKSTEDDKDLLKGRIALEVESIIASALPIVRETLSLEEARHLDLDEANKKSVEKLISSEHNGVSGKVSLCRIGNDWWELCDDGRYDLTTTPHDAPLFLADTGVLVGGAVALTSVCRHLLDDGDGGLRVSASAWETKSDMLAYKQKVEQAQGVVQTFGQLVNWDNGGALDKLEYTCLCCNPTEETQGLGFSFGGPNSGKAFVGGNGPANRRAQTRLTQESGPKIGDSIVLPSTQLTTPFVIQPNPAWLRERETIFDDIRDKRNAELALKPTVPIQVTLPDGTVLGEERNLTSWTSTPLDVARCVSDGLANVAVVARVTYTSRLGSTDDIVAGGDGMDKIGDDGDDTNDNDNNEHKAELWDLTRPLEGDCNIEILTFDSNDDAAKAVFWHSSAHILGQTLEHKYGALLTIGPPIAGGFYYDAYLGNGEGLKDSQFGEMEEEFRQSTKRKEPFERLVVTKDEALDLFQYSPFKTALIKAKVPDNTRTTVYRNGDLIDLCMGPHVPHTGKIKAFKMLRCSATQWLGDANNDQLQRVYGISFPSKKMLKVHMANLEKARERDHRRLGQQQKLFMFHALSPGSAFFLPHGTIVYNALCEFIRKQYVARGYSEVVTPNVYNLKLWEQSGHAKHYKDDMFTFDVEGEEWGMKPMNCPGHCLLFAGTTRSYRELPMRIADFGVLHRNEQSGALTGLTRVRRFQQDDAHIFCTEEQIEQEVVGCLEFMKFVYDVFGMSYRLELSTRPAKALGETALWDQAEAALAGAMDSFAGAGNWKVNPGDGAFYGPKIDIKVMDAMDRVHQCATIQLDFQLPIRFDLRYRKKGGGEKEAQEVVVDVTETPPPSSPSSSSTEISEDKYENNVLPPDFARPVMVHRAMLGSVERMFAVLLEHYGGKWPFWLSPRQALVVPVGMDFVPYAQTVRDRLKAAGFHPDIDDSTKSLKKKIRDGQLAQYNYILVVGETEQTNDSVAVRNRNNEQEGEKKVEDVIQEFRELCDTYK